MSGIGGQNHIALGLVAAPAGVDVAKLKMIGFAGSSDSITAVIGGHALRMDRENWWRGSVLVPYAEGPANILRALVGERKIEP